MNCVLSLPKDVLRNDVFQFLSIKGLVQLDSAVTSTQFRDYLLSVIFRISVQTIGVRINYQIAQWLSRRQVALNIVHFDPQITDNTLCLMGYKQGRVREICFETCDRISARALSTFLSNMKGTFSLNFDSCNQISPCLVEAVCLKCPDVRHVSLANLGFLGNDSILKLSLLCEQLVSIDLTMHSQLTDSVVCQLVAGCPLLEVINLHGCISVSDAAIIAIAKGCPGLKRLVLSYCTRITNASLVAVACNCPGLVSLEIVRCRAISDPGLTALARGCPLLESLNANQCMRITDASMCYIAYHSARLQSLSISECASISSGKGIATLIERCPHLQKLNLAGYKFDTSGVVQAMVAVGAPLTHLDLSLSDLRPGMLEQLLQHCTQLQSLNLTGCSYLSPHGIESAKQVLIRTC